MAREGAESNSIASLSVYAEFLPKLGRISVVAHLPSRSTSETKAFVSDGGQSLVIQHGGVATKLVLPARIEQSSQQLSGDVPPGLDKLSWRLIAHPDELAAAGSGRPGFDSGAVPWSALDLKPGAGVSCRECDNIIVPRTRLREWKDLPSENWAEMMEFWHCHKPTSHKRVKLDGEEALEDQQASRGYGANNAIAAQMGVGFVDLTKMLFHNEDLSISQDEGDSRTSSVGTITTQNFLCPSCSTQLGHFERRKNGVSLFKWRIKLIDEASPSTTSQNAPELSHCLAAALIATQARSGAGKVVLQGEEEAITLWVLNPHIKFSCAERERVPAMKLLFQNKAMDEEEIDLPDEVVKEVRGVLQDSRRYLPLDERNKMVPSLDGAWTVALLERVER